MPAAEHRSIRGHEDISWALVCTVCRVPRKRNPSTRDHASAQEELLPAIEVLHMGGPFSFQGVQGQNYPKMCSRLLQKGYSEVRTLNDS